MLTKLFHIWTGPLPKEELFPSNRKPNPLLHWLIHPLKRHTARVYLRMLQKIFGLKVIAIGGSNGKTTTRNMLMCVLPKIVATRDSITSTYNIPTSIFRLRPWTKFFICEMSVEYIGDMDFYLWLAKPDIAILTLIDVEHTQFLGSIENVTREELKILRGKWLKIVNGNSPQIPYKNYSNCYTFGTSEKFACFIKSAELTRDFATRIELFINHKSFIVNLPAIGTHLAHPLAATLLTLNKLGISISDFDIRISNFKSPPHRLQIVNAKSGAIIIDDTYNSNPSSALAAIDTAVKLANLTNRELIVILSQMNELGSYEIPAHQKLADQISKLGIRHSHVFSVGPAAAKIGQNFNSSEDLISHIRYSKFNTRHLILVKASRSWKLENLISLLA